MFELAIKLVAQSPENFAYHLIIILCLQVSFALAFWLWLKSPKENVVTRLMITAGVIFVLRIGWGVVLLVFDAERQLLAPVERAVNFLTIVFYVWALAPTWVEVQRLRVLGLFLAVIGVAIGLPYAYQNWAQALLIGGIEYGATNQAPVWSMLQLIYLFGCIFSLGMFRPYDWVLRVFAVVPLIVSSLMHLFNFTPASFGVDNILVDVANGIIPLWDRMGLLVALPLFTAVIYRRNFSYLLNRSRVLAGSPESLTSILDRFDRVLSAGTIEDQSKDISQLFNELFDTQFVGVSRVLEKSSPYRDVHLFQKNEAGTAFQSPRVWMLNVHDWPSIQEAVNRKQIVQLTPSSSASRQLYEIHQEFHLRYVTPIMIVPLIHDKIETGILFLGSPLNQTVWPNESIELVAPFSRLLAREFAEQANAVSILSNGSGELSVVDELAYDARIDELEDQKKKTEARLFQMAARLHEAERALRVSESKLDNIRQADAGDARQLKNDIHSLRHSLLQLGEDERIAKLVNENGAGSNEDWITQAITQYSSELELSQQRINRLETRLRSIYQGNFRNSISAIGEEARSPLTSIQAYTDLLLQDETGFLTVRQIDLLQRIKTSTTLVVAFLNSLDESLRFGDQIDGFGSMSDLSQILDLVLEQHKDLIQEKKIQLELDVDESLPPIMVDRGTMYQILSDLLRNALKLIERGKSLRLTADYQAIKIDDQIAQDIVKFIRLNLYNVKLSAVDQQRLMDNVGHANGHLDSLEEESVDFSRMYQTARTVGGRVWLEDQGESCSQTIILLLPVGSLSLMQEEADAG